MENSNNEKVSVTIQCTDCYGTGIVKDTFFSNSSGLICLTCKGTGATTITYTPFTHRNIRPDITIVKSPRGSFCGICDTHLRELTYDQFLDLIPEPPEN